MTNSVSLLIAKFGKGKCHEDLKASSLKASCKRMAAMRHGLKAKIP